MQGLCIPRLMTRKFFTFAEGVAASLQRTIVLEHSLPELSLEVVEPLYRLLRG
jgi:hypothetical protein